MIQWCAFCQKFYGFQAPFDAFDLTHGICAACYNKYSAGDTERLPLVEQRNFFADLSRSAAAFDFHSIDRLLDEGIKIGISAQDLLIRVLQPSLYEIGRLWSEGKITITDEHRFTAVSNSILELLFAKFPATGAYRGSSTPQLLLTLVEGNRHSLGLKMVEFILASHDIPTFTLYQALPAHEIFELTKQLQPQYVGLSIAILYQLLSVTHLQQLFLDAGLTTRIILGGFPITPGFTLDPALRIELHTDMDHLIAKFKP